MRRIRLNLLKLLTFLLKPHILILVKEKLMKNKTVFQLNIAPATVTF